mgnify:CR=1 FL=1
MPHQLCKIVKIHFKVIFRQTCRVPVFILFVHLLHLFVIVELYINKLNVRNTSYTILRVVPVVLSALSTECIWNTLKINK